MSHVLVIAGAKEDDYEAEEEPSRARAEEPAPTESSTKKEEAGNEASEAGKEERRVSDIGSISFVSCATGEDAMTSLGGNQEAEEGNYICPHFCSCFFCLLFYFSIFFCLFFSEGKTRLTKETAVEIGMFNSDTFWPDEY